MIDIGEKLEELGSHAGQPRYPVTCFGTPWVADERVGHDPSI